ncbi:GNAT family N-acetyltransferase [Micromonospora sp. NPDC023737]|uniref:GNAT family N-acetyltransferase n=1 Tax=unclassified Micromonospora TaxID=2617518 RepID=UPI00340328C7
MTLPAGWSARRPTLDDVPAILTVVHAADTFAVGYPDFDAADVEAALSGPYADPSRDSWLALDPEGHVVGWTSIDNPTGTGREFVDVYVDPERGRQLRGTLLARQLDRVAERAAERSLPALTVRCAAFEPERDWERVLRDTGFTLAKRYVRMRRPLADLPAEPPPPAGVTVRPVDPDDELDLREFHRIFDTAFRDTPDYEPLGYAEWRKKVTQHGTSWDEWFVAEVDGVAVGTLQSSDQALDQDEGFVRSLSVLPGFRRRGVGAALLRRVFTRYAEKGRAAAGLGVDLTNPTTPLSLYHSVGLRETRWTDMFELVVPAASTSGAPPVG